jgi:GT2 family glycosyltransferase
MKFTVMIATKNRVDDLRRTCQVLTQLSPPADEVIICADGCNDDTVKMVKQEFPLFTLIENEQSIGSVGSRHRILNLAKGEFVVSLDDDSYPLDLNFLDRSSQILSDHPEAGVITFPELRNDASFAKEKKETSSSGYYVSAYPNCSAIMRRDLYLKSEGFPSFFQHMYEETDYALQCYSLNKAVWFEPSLMIRHHMSSTERQPVRRHHQNARNELWSVWIRCPFPWLILVSIFRIVRQFQYACSEGLDWAICEPVWWWSALKGLPQCLRNRQPIPWHIYYNWMRLARQPIYNYEDLKQKFKIE